ncbi:mCG145441, partial [Mus musculus]
LLLWSPGEGLPACSICNSAVTKCYRGREYKRSILDFPVPKETGKIMMKQVTWMRKMKMMTKTPCSNGDNSWP